MRWIMLALLVVLIVGCSDNKLDTNNNEVKTNFDSKILEEFNNNERILVLVKIDGSNKTRLAKIISSIHIYDFLLVKRFDSGDGFIGNVSFNGFKKLSENPYVVNMTLYEFPKEPIQIPLFEKPIIVYTQDNVTGYHDNVLFRKSGVSLNNKFLEWFNESFKEFNITHPYVLCIFNESCNGNFSINIKTIYSKNSSINNSLKTYGGIGSSSCHEKYNQCNFHLYLSNIYFVSELLNNSDIGEIHFSEIRSDYEFEEIPDDKLKYCERDDDCEALNNLCCGCWRLAINKKYSDYLNSKNSFDCQNAVCAFSLSRHISCYSETECVENRCEMIPMRELVCNSVIYEDCDEGFIYDMGNGYSCNDIVQNCHEYFSEPFDCSTNLVVIEDCAVTDDSYLDEIYNKNLTCRQILERCKG